MVKIKICGIRDVATANLCAGLGADYIGLVFAESPRRISAETAREIAGSLAGLPERPRIVGVFVNQDYLFVNNILCSCRLDIAQLSGDESIDYIKQIEAPCIKSLHVLSTVPETELLGRVEALYRFAGSGVRVLLDSRPDHRYGGSGRTFDWALAGKICARFPVMVAGGLTAQNVAGMIERLQPWGVDVSSGVEADGAKDDSLIREFVAAVKTGEPAAGGDNE